MKSKTSLGAVAFYNADGFVPAWKQATRYIGKEGRIATLPDVIAARIATEPNSVAWSSYITTLSAEYVGFSKEGKPIVIVAHGIGPMSTLKGILAAYGHEFKDKERSRRGGRISQEEFLKLESGFYGEVSIIDLTEVWKRREYAFSGHPISRIEIENEPLWQARLGKSWKEYVERHESFAKKYSKVEYENYCILGMDDASNCSYSCYELFEGHVNQTPNTAIVHLLSIGGLINSHHQYYEKDYNARENRESLASDVNCHEWSDGVRLVGILPGASPVSMANIHPGIDVDEVIISHWEKFMRPVSSPPIFGFGALVRVGNHWFTQYPKKGETMDTSEPEFLVKKIERISGPKTFSTTIGGYHGFFKYGVGEVKQIAPEGANAYYFPGDPTFGGKGHIIEVEFYKVEVDTSKRLIPKKEFYSDYDLFSKALELQIA